MRNVNVITISRESGSGGGEFGRELSRRLGFRLYDREILHAAAEFERMPEFEMERLDEREASLIDRLPTNPAFEHYKHGVWRAISLAAQTGDAVIVGRGARHFLGYLPNVLHLRLVAPLEWRAARKARLRGISIEQARSLCLETDRHRQAYLALAFGRDAHQPWQYDVVVNVQRTPPDDLVETIADIVHNKHCRPSARSSNPRTRLFTVARQLGACGPDLLKELGEKLDLDVYDREILEREATLLGVSREDLEALDEGPEPIVQRLLPSSLHKQYVAALRRVVEGIAERGRALIVGRAGNLLLAERPQAFHARFVAHADWRLLHLLGELPLDEQEARRLMARSDQRRRRFVANCFDADWEDPLQYHVVANTGRLRERTADLVVAMATRHWGHFQEVSPRGQLADDADDAHRDFLAPESL